MQRLLARARLALTVPWDARARALRRDLAMLLGAHPAPVHAARARAVDVLAAGTRVLTVREVVRETADAVTLVFEPGLPAWQPGQFLTLHVEVGGERLRRAYSLCTRASDPRGPAITLKRVPDGRVSGFLLAHAHAGMRLEVRGPSGQFVLPPRPASTPAGARHVVLVGGGSGITPLVAIAEEVLAGGDRATLLFGNRGADDIIFRARLDTLVAASDGRFAVRHVLEAPPSAWPGGPPPAIGRLDAATVVRELDALAHVDAHDPIAEVFSCGPAAMMDEVRAAFAAVALPPARLHEERFQSLGEHRATALPTTAQAVRIAVGGRVHEVLAAPGATVLEAGLAAGVRMPFSCTMGGCGACRVKLAGPVVHDTPNCLGDDEAAAGYALACVARPLGPCKVEVPS